ncbi:DUF3304 domain-containing protein [Achromobacter sp. ACM05]|uniref:DUF3304 domain-containing protein n=1 Tax=Achromobacter sp. ACM05 TaxID=2854776 RepID=UPI001C4537C6|nr:DUF3304 domain-containing protein [Achromobacter sp. ACM05]MBV7498739.1 DUF3304 domain-containing protein [Achromobacter sp. ACM05]
MKVFPLVFLALALLVVQLTSCDGRQAKQDTVGTSMTGIDHLPDHVSVQNFWVNGASGHQAGTGGSVVCCATLPRKWHPDLTVVVNWNVTNWRDCGGQSYERRVAVDPYEKVGHMFVHFLADGSVRVVSANVGPGYPGNGYLGPDDLIPNKDPWDVYGSYRERCSWAGGPVMMERAQ